jgi:tetratricopeptide (TPR) repeat protein
MRGKIAGAVLSALLFLSPAYSAGNNPDKPTAEQSDSFYAAVQDLNTDEIAMLYRKNPSIFSEKYRNYSRAQGFNATLDDKVFKALSEISYSHLILGMEEKLDITLEKITNKEPVLLIEGKTVRTNHARMIMLDDYLYTHASSQSIESLYHSAYDELRKIVVLKPTNDVMLNTSLDQGRLDSYQLGILFYDLGRRFHLPVELVRAKDFFLIRFNSDKFFNPLDNSVLSTDEVTKKYKIADESIKNSLYLKPLSEEKILAVEYARIGWFCRIHMEREQISSLLDGVYQALDNALVLDKHNIDTLRYMGQLYHFLDEYKDALENYNDILALDPTNAHAYALSGIAYFDMGNEKMAISSFKKALEFDKSTEKYIPDEYRKQLILDSPSL